jgi:hypothetical protein
VFVLRRGPWTTNLQKYRQRGVPLAIYRRPAVPAFFGFEEAPRPFSRPDKCAARFVYGFRSFDKLWKMVLSFPNRVTREVSAEHQAQDRAADNGAAWAV